MTIKNTTDTLADLYRCEPRTIRRWRSEGAPLNDATKMRQWLSGRKHLPERTRLWLLEQSDLSSDASAPGTIADSGPREETGAGNALRRLELAEAEAYSALKKAMRTGDPFAVKVARESWLKIGDSLRRYDLMLDSARRANGELVNKEHVEAALRQFAMYVQLAYSQLRGSVVSVVCGQKSMPIIDATLENFANAGLISGMATYVHWLERERPQDARTQRWMLDALNDGFGQQYAGWENSVEAQAEFWKRAQEAVRRQSGGAVELTTANTETAANMGESGANASGQLT